MTEIFLNFLVYLESEALFRELVCITKRLIKETMHFLAQACSFSREILRRFWCEFLACSKFS